MMTGREHAPGPWQALGISPLLGPEFAPYWIVSRKLGRGRSERLQDDTGKPARFGTKAAATAAAATANEAQK